MNKLVKLAKATNQRNNKKSPSTNGVNNKNTKIAVGIVPRARKGNLLPYLEEERPTTIIYPKAEGISERLKASDGSVGIRIAKDTFCQTLIQALNAPLVSTSANISGADSPKCFEEITPQIKEGVDAIVPRKQNEEQTQASRIIRLQADGKIEILRP